MKPLRREWPDDAELVVCTVTKVFPHGAFVRLEEFNMEGMIHISEISAKWIKNIKDYVQEGQRIVAKVLRINREKGHIDLSMKGLSNALTRERLKEWKNEGRADKLLQMAAKKLDRKIEDAYRDAGFPLEDTYGTVFAGLEAASKEGVEALRRAGVSAAWQDMLATVAKDNIELSKVTIGGMLELTSLKPEGVNDIRSALAAADKAGEAAIQYLGAPRYRLKVTADDYKAAEKTLKSMADAAIDSMKKAGGKGEFYRDEKVK